MPTPINLAILISGSGTTMQNLIDRIAALTLNARITTVIASRPGIQAIARAQAAKLPVHIVDKKQFATTMAFSQKIFDLIRESKADLICLAGWLCLLEIPPDFEGKIMNIHPALLPSFGGKGMYGHRVHQAVLDHGCKVSGCTVHFVDPTYDTGPIILQRTCPVEDTDTAETLAQRVFEEEKFAYQQAIELYRQDKLKIEGRRVRIM
jgi:phosphoribosylglycinamide formyltransferase 1